MDDAVRYDGALMSIAAGSLESITELGLDDSLLSSLGFLNLNHFLKVTSLVSFFSLTLPLFFTSEISYDYEFDRQNRGLA